MAITLSGGVSSSVGLLSRNNKSTRYAANLQTAKTPDSVIAPRIAALGRRPQMQDEPSLRIAHC